MLDGGQKTVLITRMGAEAACAVALSVPLAYHEIGRVGIAGEMPEPDGRGTIVVATGGTSDMPVAEEAALTAEALGNKVTRLYDVGVAGLHRLLAHTDDIMGASAIVAIAGMEGALASVIGGLADCPVYSRPDQRRLRRVVRRPLGAALDAQLLRERRLRRQHRQRLRRGLPREHDKPHRGEIE